eukprot:362776-Chlamydomonas_euryale.AAC.1
MCIRDRCVCGGKDGRGGRKTAVQAAMFVRACRARVGRSLKSVASAKVRAAGTATVAACVGVAWGREGMRLAASPGSQGAGLHQKKLHPHARSQGAGIHQKKKLHPDVRSRGAS